MHDLRDLQEVDVLGQGDEGQVASAAGLDEGVRRPVVAAYEFDDQGRCPDVGEFVDVPAHAGRVLRQGHSGGEDEFAALEERRGVGQLGDVDPPDRTVQVRHAGDDVGPSGGQDGKRQDIGHGERTGGPLAGRVVVVHGLSKGSCSDSARSPGACPATVTSVLDLRKSGP